MAQQAACGDTDQATVQPRPARGSSIGDIAIAQTPDRKSGMIARCSRSFSFSRYQSRSKGFSELGVIRRRTLICAFLRVLPARGAHERRRVGAGRIRREPSGTALAGSRPWGVVRPPAPRPFMPCLWPELVLRSRHVLARRAGHRPCLARPGTFSRTFEAFGRLPLACWRFCMTGCITPRNSLTCPRTSGHLSKAA